jgi:hypothetical protein
VVWFDTDAMLSALSLYNNGACIVGMTPKVQEHFLVKHGHPLPKEQTQAWKDFWEVFLDSDYGVFVPRAGCPVTPAQRRMGPVMNEVCTHTGTHLHPCTAHARMLYLYTTPAYPPFLTCTRP